MRWILRGMNIDKGMQPPTVRNEENSILGDPDTRPFIEGEQSRRYFN